MGRIKKKGLDRDMVTGEGEVAGEGVRGDVARGYRHGGGYIRCLIKVLGKRIYEKEKTRRACTPGRARTLPFPGVAC